MNYAEKLLDERWLALRERRLERDGYVCYQCSDRNNLNVHHVIYISGLEPWQYELKDLITLCKTCHETYHLKEKKHVSDEKKEEIREQSMMSEEDRSFEYKRRDYIPNLLAMMPPEIRDRILSMGQEKKVIR